MGITEDAEQQVNAENGPGLLEVFWSNNVFMRMLLNLPVSSPRTIDINFAKDPTVPVFVLTVMIIIG